MFGCRCYNCGEYGNHVAAKCKLGPMPKRCHHCKSEDHLIADCPHRFNKNNVVIADDQTRENSDKTLVSGVAGLSLSEGGGGDVKRESNAWKWKRHGFFEPPGKHLGYSYAHREMRLCRNKGEFFWGKLSNIILFLKCRFKRRESMFGN